MSSLCEGLLPSELDWLRREFARPVLGAGRPLYRAGDAFRSLFLVERGGIKTRTVTRYGRERVTGFHTAGALLGAEGLARGVHGADAVTFIPTELLELPYARIEDLCKFFPNLGRNLYRALGREIAHGHDVMRMLSRSSAGERVAALIVRLAREAGGERLRPGGVELPATRADVASYLGLRLETVSRELSRLARNGTIRVRGRQIEVMDIDALAALVPGAARSEVVARRALGARGVARGKTLEA